MLTAPTAVAKLVERLHQSPFRCSMLCTGAGGAAVGALMSVPGCSRTLIDAQIPYHTTVSRTILDQHPKTLVSEKVGVELAQAAFHRCLQVAEIDGLSKSEIIGLGATAAIATDRSRKGADVAYISCWASEGVTSYRLLLDRSHDRNTQESVVSKLILAALAEGARVPLGELRDELPQLVEIVPATAAEAADCALQGPCFSKTFTRFAATPLESLLSGAVDCVLFNCHGCPRLSLPPFRVDDVDPSRAHYLLYPGSFNPLHWGHTELARIASAVVASREAKPVIVTYEVAISRVGKKDLTSNDLQLQAQQFAAGGHRVAFTTAKLFVEKARMFPHHGLVVGIDTVVRVLNPTYYGDDKGAMLEAMHEIRRHNCYFVCGGRMRDGEWVDLSQVDVPEEIKDMFVPIPQSQFRVDISSTEIRERRATTPTSNSPAPSA